MIKTTYNNNKGIFYFFNLFNSKKLTFPKAYFFGVKSRKKKLPVSEKLWTGIISTYFDTYFDDFYKSDKPMYFPLSGKLKKVKGKGFYKQSMESLKVSESIIWLWYLRPAFNYVTNIKILKAAGSNGRVYKLDTAYKEDNDMSKMEDFKKSLKELNINQKLYTPC